MGDLADAAEDIVSTDELRRALRNTQAQLKKAKAKRDELAAVAVEACTEAVLSTWSPAKIKTPVLKIKPGKGGAQASAPEHALIHATDWQGAKRTASYDSEVMKDRAAQLWEKVEHLVAIYRSGKMVRDASLLIGGDMIEGLFNFPTQPYEIDATLFQQFVTVAGLLVDGVRTLLRTFEKVSVFAEWGNHGRLGSKRSVVPRNDNADRMTYELARNILMGTPDADRIMWEDSPDDVQRVEIGNYRALLLHGDEIGRNGFASPMTIVQHVARWQSGAYPWEFNDAYVGHYHTHNEWALPNGLGSVYQTGSMESDNRYAGIGLASSATPSQRLHIIDPGAGRVINSYKVWLD